MRIYIVANILVQQAAIYFVANPEEQGFRNECTLQTLQAINGKAVFWWNLPQVWQMLPIQSKWRQDGQELEKLPSCIYLCVYYMRVIYI